MTAPVSVRGVSRFYGEAAALADVSLEIAAGEFIVLLGPSGCGKTTLLSILGGFVSPSAGQVFIGGRDMDGLPPAKRPTTTMFQDYALFPHMSLIDNVGFGLRMRGQPRRARDARAMECLEMVGLATSAKRRPHELSGGQRQRVALARALAVDPDVLLLDEPLGALDLGLRRQMQEELKAIQKRVGTTFIHVTHDQEEAMAIADRIVVMNAGKVEDFATPAEIYLRPRSLFSAGFMGECNFLSARVEGPAGQGALALSGPAGPLTLPEAAFIGPAPAPGTRVTLCIRPEHLGPGPGGIPLGQGRIERLAFLGAHTRAVVSGATGPLIVALPQNSTAREGDSIALRAAPEALVALPAAGD
ncbi:ABC transporter ATP-binding protein [Oceanicella sp. SM1341]|uniref:ABC transporter ATP-binding protein n=1 Tax=Oceanicella sp. SM1341 TaxID=1548889 RepID=UPI000E4A5F17